jgi:hypothetical protein
MKYKVTREQTALGIYHRFEGPGLSRFVAGVHLLQPLNEWAAENCAKGMKSDDEAETIVNLLHAAFAAGQDRAMKEIRTLLGVKDK